MFPFVQTDHRLFKLDLTKHEDRVCAHLLWVISKAEYVLPTPATHVGTARWKAGYKCGRYH